MTFGIEDSDRNHNALFIGVAIVAAACLSKLKDTPATRCTASESIAVAEFMLKGVKDRLRSRAGVRRGER